MKAFVCTEFGPVDNCGVQEIDARSPEKDQILIEVKSASLNFPDALMVEGRYQVKPPLPFSPGMDLAGIVREVGQGVTHVAPGDRVIAFSGVGAFAEMCLAPKDKVVPMPEGMSFDAAAAFGITYATAIHAFQECGRLLPNETVLVLGAAGGVGIAAIEVAKAMGAHVIAAASTDEKLALCREKGANATINYSQENLRALVARVVQHERRVERSARVVHARLTGVEVAPGVEQVGAEPAALDRLQELLGDDGIGIHIRPVQRGDEAIEPHELFHHLFFLAAFSIESPAFSISLPMPSTV